jgi:uncharacterized protein YqeY
MDYLTIGSNGFAQVGRPDFYEKNKIEMRVLMQYLVENYQFNLIYLPLFHGM